MIIEKYNEDLGKYITLVHEATEGRYELTGYDKSVIEAALCQLQDEEMPMDDRLKRIDNGLASVFVKLSPNLTLNMVLQLDDLRIAIMHDIRKIVKNDQVNKPVPVRIQRKRTQGWGGMPENTVYCGRPGKWGNPFIGDMAVERYEDCVLNNAMVYKYFKNEDAEFAFSNFKWISENVHILKGKNLACWCPLHKKCHCDILLRLANEDCN